jgi:molybdate transport system regulatory protein
MHAAVRELQMSCRGIWMRIRMSVERIGKPLVVREGNGSKLTPFAEKLMKQCKRLDTLFAAESDEVYESLMSDHLTWFAMFSIRATITKRFD